MRYFISKDKDGYVCNIRHTNTRLDTIELNLDDYDLTGFRLFAYKVGKDKLVFDDIKYQELINEQQLKDNQKEIAELKEKLNESDYLVARTFEQVMELSNPLTWVADVIKITTQFNKKYKETIAKRKEYRKRIEELQN